MENVTKKSVYIVSGAAGVGKSTTSKALVKALPRSAYLSGDAVSHMHVNGRQKPWESKEEVALIWSNLLSLTKNFLAYGNDVVIDYVTFPHEARWLYEHIKHLQVDVKYIVLWTDEDTLRTRDARREPPYQMGERCAILLKAFQESGLEEKHMLKTTDYTVAHMPSILAEIIHNQSYVIT